jgi:uncharacterized membrane protein
MHWVPLLRTQSLPQSPESGRRVGTSQMLACLGLIVILADHCASASSRVSDDEIMQIIKKRCVTCHSENPTHTMFLNQPPPKDLAFDSIDEVRQAVAALWCRLCNLSACRWVMKRRW